MVTKEDWTATRTGSVCCGILLVCYGAGLIKDNHIQGNGPNHPRKLPKLAPHSYRTLVLSIASLAIILTVLWIIKAAKLSRLLKYSPIRLLFKFIPNSPDTDEEEEETLPDSSPSDHISARERILASCKDLERRMARLEECLVPLAVNIEILSRQIDNGDVARSGQLNGGTREDDDTSEHTAESGLRRRGDNGPEPIH